VRKWEYKKLALNEAPRRGDEIDLLCDAGDEGWELVAVLPNGVAYLKRELEDVDAGIEAEAGASEEAVSDEPAGEVRADTGVVATVARGVEVKPKYRDPVTGDTWTGRGRMASWLKRKQDAGEDIEKYRV
jgi:hypothetical protein